MSSHLAAFLLARIAEDEQTARAALPGPWLVGTAREHLVDWVVYGQSRGWSGHLGQACNVELAHDGSANAVHIARWDPARVLAECTAKRAILAEHPSAGPIDETWSWDRKRPWCVRCSDADEGPTAYPCRTVLALVQLYADHVDFDAAWAAS